MRDLSALFGDENISKGLWFSRSPDLSLSDFFMWGYIKDNVFRNNPQNLHELKANISNIIIANVT
jgi:hypothetical protein